jgi:hypothetical protein
MAKSSKAKPINRYSQIIEAIFFSHYKKGDLEFEFHRREIEEHAARLKIHLPKNLGDLIYSFRFRAELPEKICACSPPGREWMIQVAGRSKYRFVATTSQIHIAPNNLLVEVKVPDATPGIVSMYAFGDEQALLAKIRYNRLLDIFTRTASYSLQSHLRTSVPNLGQVETDEIYVGVDRSGSHFVFPVQAKGGKDKLSFVQIRQDWEMCRAKFPMLHCRPIAAQFLKSTVIALFEFEVSDKSEGIAAERHYRLVSPEEISTEDLQKYAVLRSD